MSDYMLYRRGSKVVIRNVDQRYTTAFVLTDTDSQDNWRIMCLCNHATEGVSLEWLGRDEAIPVFKQLVGLVEKTMGGLGLVELQIANETLAILGGNALPRPPDDDDVPF